MNGLTPISSRFSLTAAAHPPMYYPICTTHVNILAARARVCTRTLSSLKFCEPLAIINYSSAIATITYVIRNFHLNLSPKWSTSLFVSHSETQFPHRAGENALMQRNKIDKSLIIVTEQLGF